MKRMAAVDLGVLVLYLAGMVVMGWWCGRGRRTADRFMAGGRALPGWAVGLSIFGTYVSSISFLALPGKAYATNWNAFAFSLPIPIAAWVAVRYFVPFYRRSGLVSAYTHLEQRFGPWARTYAVACYLLTQLARMGTILYLVALAVAPLTGWPVWSLILITGVVVLSYTLLGGMEAVIWTDVVQSVVLIGGALACLGLLLVDTPGGIGHLVGLARAHHKFSLGSFGPSLREPTFWVVLVYGLFINLQNFGIDQNYVQRYAMSRSDQEANKSVWLGSLLYLPISALFFLIGTALFAYYTAQPALLPSGTKADAVFPYFITTVLPVGVSGLVIAAVFAAAQSTLSSSVGCSATLILCDLYRRYWRPQATEAESLRVLRWATVGVALAGTGMALAMTQVKSALDAWWSLASIFSGGMLGLFLLGRLARATHAAAATGVTIGVLIICWMSFSPDWTGAWSRFRSPFHNFLVIVIGTLVILLVGLIVSSLSKSGKPRTNQANA